MKSLFIKETFKYDGTQLRTLFAYLNHNILGDSIVSWIGPCEVSFEHMVDGEDLLDKSKICGDKMLHFIIEIFDRNLLDGVLLQRLFASIAKDLIEELNPKISLRRSGDDLYMDDKKLSISIATRSPQSIMIHFALNINNLGTPVKTCSLEDFNIDVNDFIKKILIVFVNEYNSSVDATFKVRPVS